ncbi:MAG: hypothetical protein U9P79_09475 [Candidatus Cloacimonadota bacterium]|nr:hypothetical protein [Candidatus Cloacimonadota bacterium]
MVEFSNARLENGKLKTYDTVEVEQSKLTSDCWLIQFRGLEACESCDLKGTDECGGGETLKRLKNIKASERRK